MRRNRMKMFLAMSLIGALALSVVGCGKTDTKTAEPKAGDDVKTVSILQFAPHGSLDNCRKGFIEGLKAGGFEEGKNLKIQYDNSQADTGIANQIANQYATNKPDLVCGIATPAAQALYNACSKQSIPVIYTAVSDPVAAGLAKEDGSSVPGITGTSDILPLEAQVDMIKKLMPKAKTIGVLYSTSEKNSESNIARLQKICDEKGMKLETVGVNAASDIPQAADNLLSKVDCVNNLTDNLVVNNLDVLLDKAKKKHIPIFGSEIEQVKKGCVAAMNIDYVALGKQTGEMAARVLKGEPIDKIPFEIIKESSFVYNEAELKDFGIKLPTDLKGEAVK